MENRFVKYYSERSLWKKIREMSKAAGTQVIYAVLLLFYVMKNSNVSLKTKLAITAALGYFIFPADAIPDLAPLIGFSDDLGVLLFALTQIAASITPEIKSQAKEKLNEWFGAVDEKELLALEEKIS